MNHEAVVLADALGVSAHFLNFMSFNVAVTALSKPVHESRSGIIEAVTNGIDAFWGEYPRIEKAISRKEKLILEMTVAESTTDLIRQHSMLRDEHQEGLVEELRSMAAEAKEKYYSIK